MFNNGIVTIWVPSFVWFSIAFTLYFLGVLGILRENQNFLTLLLKIEMMYIGISFYFLGEGYYTYDPAGIAQGLLVLSFAAAESAFGLSLFFYYYLTQQGKALDPVFRYNKRPEYNIKI